MPCCLGIDVWFLKTSKTVPQLSPRKWNLMNKVALVYLRPLALRWQELALVCSHFSSTLLIDIVRATNYIFQSIAIMHA